MNEEKYDINKTKNEIEKILKQDEDFSDEIRDMIIFIITYIKLRKHPDYCIVNTGDDNNETTKI